jgi:hypothetical protein
VPGALQDARNLQAGAIEAGDPGEWASLREEQQSTVRAKKLGLMHDGLETVKEMTAVATSDIADCTPRVQTPRETSYPSIDTSDTSGSALPNGRIALSPTRVQV